MATNYLLPCTRAQRAGGLAGFSLSGRDALRHAAFAFIGVVAIQAVLLIQSLAGWLVPSPLLRALDCASAPLMGWAFFGQRRGAFLVSALSLCGVLGAFTLSLWQLNGEDMAWMVRLWGSPTPPCMAQWLCRWGVRGASNCGCCLLHLPS
jgi:hypothetical protein